MTWWSTQKIPRSLQIITPQIPSTRKRVQQDGSRSIHKNQWHFYIQKWTCRSHNLEHNTIYNFSKKILRCILKDMSRFYAENYKTLMPGDQSKTNWKEANTVLIDCKTQLSKDVNSPQIHL